MAGEGRELGPGRAAEVGSELRVYLGGGGVAWEATEVTKQGMTSQTFSEDLEAALWLLREERTRGAQIAGRTRAQPSAPGEVRGPRLGLGPWDAWRK